MDSYANWCGDEATRLEVVTAKAHLQTLRAALDKAKPPFCSGTKNVRKRDLLLFYGNAKGDLGRIDMSNASPAELEKLANACAPATFGHADSDKDVLDPSYRKAGKLDLEHFAAKLDLESAGLTDAIRYGLFEGTQSSRAFFAELYKLNVYDKGAFFKAHMDTPRGTNMFGSLVVVYPTAHEGGALILRHGGKEWTFDSGRLLAEKDKMDNDDSAPIAYAMFFSDVEHEVTPVTSGYRVTLTYNLYFGNDSDEIVQGPRGSILTGPAAEHALAYPSHAALFKTALSNLLAGPSFMPEGGSLGFGLFHKYPIIKSSRSIDDLEKHLKGRDAMVLNVCTELLLSTKVWFLYTDEDFEMEVLTRGLADPQLLYEAPLADYLLNNTNWHTERLQSRSVKDLVRQPWSDTPYDDKPRCSILWVNDILPDLNSVQSAYAAYGNEPMVRYAYANVCLVVEIGPPGKRSTVASPHLEDDSDY